MLNGMTTTSTMATAVSGVAYSTSVVIGANLKVKAGMAVSGTGIGTNATVYSIDSTGVNLVLTVPNSGTVSGTLTFIDQYYIGLGKSEPFTGLDGSDSTPGNPLACHRTNINVRNNLIVLKKVVAGASGLTTTGSAGYLIPRINWTSLQSYKQYDQTDPTVYYPTTSGVTTLYPCYVISNSKIYICLSNGSNGLSTIPASSVAPSGSTLYAVETESDGYSWCYVAAIGLDSGVNDTNQFVKIQVGGNAGATSVTPGAIYAADIIQSGLGYTSNTYTGIPIKGDGTGGVATVIVSAGSISSVQITSHGSGYTYGTIDTSDKTFSTGGSPTTPGIIYPLITPILGIGYNPVSDLPAWFCGLYALFGAPDSAYVGTDDQPAATTFRQVSVLRNPVVIDTNANGYARCLKWIRLASAPSTTPTIGDMIEANGTGLPRGIVDYYDGSTYTVYYHQNDNLFYCGNGTPFSINPIPFGSSGQISKVYQKASGSGVVTLASPINYDLGETNYTTTPVVTSIAATSNTTSTISFGVTPPTSISIGMYVVGLNIPNGTYITGITGSGSTMVITVATSSSTTPLVVSAVSGIIYFITPESEYTSGTGDVIYVYNRTPLQLTLGQSEAVNVVIQF